LVPFAACKQREIGGTQWWGVPGPFVNLLLPNFILSQFASLLVTSVNMPDGSVAVSHES